MTHRLAIAIALVCAASNARADEAAPDSEHEELADLTLGLVSDAAVVGCVNLTPYGGAFVEVCDGLADAFDSYGGAVGITVPVAAWHQPTWTLGGGLPGHKQIRLGPGVGYKAYRACLWKECDDGNAIDLFARFDFHTWVSSSVGLLARVEAGGSRLEHGSGDTEWYPYLSAKVGLAFGR